VGVEADRAVKLAEGGHCTEALPLLRKSIRQSVNRDLKKRVGLYGLRCAMTHSTPYDSLEFLSVLSRDFPHDPEVLYAATHAYSDLSLHASQDLAEGAVPVPLDIVGGDGDSVFAAKKVLKQDAEREGQTCKFDALLCERIEAIDLIGAVARGECSFGVEGVLSAHGVVYP